MLLCTEYTMRLTSKCTLNAFVSSFQKTALAMPKRNQKKSKAKIELVQNNYISGGTSHSRQTKTQIDKKCADSGCIKFGDKRKLSSSAINDSLQCGVQLPPSISFCR